jgi:hypothetical protein
MQLGMNLVLFEDMSVHGTRVLAYCLQPPLSPVVTRRTAALIEAAAARMPAAVVDVTSDPTATVADMPLRSVVMSAAIQVFLTLKSIPLRGGPCCHDCRPFELAELPGQRSRLTICCTWRPPAWRSRRTCPWKTVR